MNLFDADGLVTSIYHYLWTQDPIKQAIPTVLIPDTIIYQNSSPVNWYFTQAGVVKQKSKSKLNPEYIYEHMLKHKSRSGVVALWVSMAENGCKYEYMNENDLKAFFDDRVTIKQGMLQSFIDPKGDQNFTISCIWGSKLCFFEKRKNINKIDDPNIDMYQRVLTYEVEKMQSVKEPLVGKVLPQKLENQTYNIVDHIQILTHDRYKITRLVINYRIDNLDQIWLLNCSAIRVKDKLNPKPHNKLNKRVYDQTSMIRIPEEIDQKRLTINKGISCWRDKFCNMCDIQLNQNDLYPIRYRDIVESWNFDHIGNANQNGQKTKQINERNDSQGKIKPFKRVQTMKTSLLEAAKSDNHVTQPMEINKNYKVPELMRKLMPKLKEKRYLELIENPGFMDRTIEVCQKCYIHINKGVNVTEDVGKLAYQEQMMCQELMGTGKLKPQVIQKRYELTRRFIKNRDQEKIQNSETIKHTWGNSKSSQELFRSSSQTTQIPFFKVSQLTSLTITSFPDSLMKPIFQNSEYTRENQGMIQDEIGIKESFQPFNVPKLPTSTSNLREQKSSQYFHARPLSLLEYEKIYKQA